MSLADLQHSDEDVGGTSASALGAFIDHVVPVFASGLGLVCVLFGSNALIARWTGVNLEIVTALIARNALSLMGLAVTGSGDLVGLEYQVRVVTECTGLTAMVLVGAFILPFPVPWKSRLTGLLVAFSLIYTLNVARLVALVLIHEYRPDAMHLAHDVVWPIFVVLIVLGFFYSWGRRQIRSAASR